jgi:hypothetical protein
VISGTQQLYPPYHQWQHGYFVLSHCSPKEDSEINIQLM